MGQRALCCYVVHFFLILIAYNLVFLLAGLPWYLRPAMLGTILQLGVVLVLWALLRKRVLFGIIPN